MPKAAKTLNVERISSKENAYLMLPWSCKHYADRSEIEAHVPGKDWQMIAEIQNAAGIDAEVIGNFIIRAVNKFEITQDLASQMATALERCLACDGKLTWEAEQEAQVILSRFRLT